MRENSIRQKGNNKNWYQYCNSMHVSSEVRPIVFKRAYSKESLYRIAVLETFLKVGIKSLPPHFAYICFKLWHPLQV